ncbi:MAG: beta-galactosidase trimerization domain-containing protein [Chloroflexi bacterium]|nr:beta-galactosidase trimerization domain-containing protein [Chloroflexota bacterium]
MPLTLRQRQIHLDFHTSPYILDVGVDFDARAFAQQMKHAHVNSVTVFAKCHHGQLYYDTSHPARHPGLKKGLDLTGEQVAALHAEGIRAPIYISVLLDEYAANTHPEWIARNEDGSNVGAKPLQAGWRVMDMTSPYQDCLAEQTAEVLARYKPVDGIFFDICMDILSLSKYAIAAMLKKGYNPENMDDRKRFAHEVTLAYMKRFYKLVKASAPKATVYFNSRPLTALPDDIQYLTHVEIEALPTGGWGYMYFPKNVRYARTFDKPYMGMTARFHKSWADFGGLKPFAALKYEVCQMLAHGAQCSIGDQLHPRGRLDEAAYDLIGSVYAYAEACEPWTQDAQPVTQIGLFMADVDPTAYREEPGGTNDGATRMLTQLKHQFDVVTAQSDLSAYELLILPDSVTVDETLAQKLRDFLAQGGSLLLSGRSGLGVDQQPVLPEMGVQVEGDSPYKTTYLRFGTAVGANVPKTDHVMYERGLRMLASEGAEVLAKVVEPYFDRNYQHFSSHAQTPPVKNASEYAAAVRCGNVITIAYPIFKAYGTHANLPYRLLVQNCIDLLMPHKLVDVTAPSTMEVTVMHKRGRKPATVVHLLQFVAERRTDVLDLVEDIVPVYNVPMSVRAGDAPSQVYLAPSGEMVDFEYADGCVNLIVPSVEGHQMVVIES